MGTVMVPETDLDSQEGMSGEKVWIENMEVEDISDEGEGEQQQPAKERMAMKRKMKGITGKKKGMRMKD